MSNRHVDHDAWPAFAMPWNDNAPGATDMSFLLHRPAGSQGFVRNVDGHLAFENGERLRLWGVNMCTELPLPPVDHAPTVARHLAKFGVNCVRLHAIDHRFPLGIIQRARHPERADHWRGDEADPTRALDPEGLARLDYFIACCKAEGVYLDLNLNVARSWTAADGVAGTPDIQWGKGLTYFDRRLIDLQKGTPNNWWVTSTPSPACATPTSRPSP